MEEVVQRPERNFGLDAVRSLAILMVIFSHGCHFLKRTLPHNFSFTVATGWGGVEIFFGLSGFLIGCILYDLSKTPNEQLPAAVRIFLVRRWMRTLPIYFLCLAAYYTFPVLDTEPREQIWSYFLLLQNFSHPFYEGNWFGPSWSLVLEEWSYVLLPILAFFVLRKRLPLTLLLTIAAAEVFRILIVPHYIDLDFAIRKIFLLRLDAIAYGAIAAYFYKKYDADFMKWLGRLTPLSFSLFFFCCWYVTRLNFYYDTFARNFMLPVWGVSIACLVPLATKLKPFCRPAIEYIAKISYCAYLSHWAFMFLLGNSSVPYKFGLFLIGVLAVSSTLSYVVEYPIMRMRPRQQHAIASPEAIPSAIVRR